MIGSMIKICSLDFLNKEFFETDVMAADGSVLFSAGEKITPELILRLYFKDIYVNEVVVKNETCNVLVSSVANEVESEEIASTPTEKIAANESIHGPRSVTTSPMEKEETFSGPRSVTTSPIAEVEEEASGGPRFVESNITNVETKEKTLYQKSAKASIDDDTEVKTEIIDENPENKPLIFDEEQAKRIVQYSIKIGKLLKLSDTELDELEQVAYNCNIGITDFKKADLCKKEFRRMKAFASYEKLLTSGTVSEKIAEMVKFSASSYDSDSFPLNSKIPHHHIVAIAGYYEDLFNQTNSKEKTLLKMLQLGGNQFNIFVLHKFIKVMRESNE